MAFTMRAVKVPPNSASMEEARHRVFDYFRQACRSVPSIMEIYNLYDVVTPSQLRSTIAKEIRKNQSVSNPKVASASLDSVNSPLFDLHFASSSIYPNRLPASPIRSLSDLRDSCCEI